MSKVLIEESEMQFVADSETLFRIENDDYVRSVEGLKTCEYVTWTPNELIFMEAKKSFAAPNGERGRMAFEESVNSIKDKFCNSFQLFVAYKSNRFEQTTITVPQSADEVDLKACKLEFYVVIKNHKREWLSAVTDALRKEMRVFFKLWNIKDASLKVLNEQNAIDRGLVLHN